MDPADLLSAFYQCYTKLCSEKLRSAKLSRTNFDGINCLASLGIMPDSKGMARAYKVTTAQGEGIYRGGVNYIKHRIFSADLDKDIKKDCSLGINLATFSWCLNAFTDKTYHLFMFKFNVKDAVCPVGSDGKFRVKKCIKVGECDWQGNLLK